MASARKSGIDTEPSRDLASLPPAPDNPLPYRQRLAAVRSFHTGMDTLRDAGGPVTRVKLGPRWLIPPIVVATSPQGLRDVLGGRDGSFDKTSGVPLELRRLIGPNLFDLPYEDRWLAAWRMLGINVSAVSSRAGHA